MTAPLIDTADWLKPSWDAPSRVRGVVTTRSAVLSAGPYGGFNTADHVGDDPAHVMACRDWLGGHFGFRHAPVWLDQVHGTDVVEALPDTPRQPADAVTTVVAGLPVTIHTADCLPVFFTNKTGSRVAIAHAGWRGLLGGVIEHTLQRFNDPAADILVWLGPAIGPAQFEVGDEVRRSFIDTAPEHAQAFLPSPFTPDGAHWLCDIYLLARQRLARRGVVAVTGGNLCTVSDDRFFSYRRDRITGRMLSLLWINT